MISNLFSSIETNLIFFSNTTSATEFANWADQMDFSLGAITTHLFLNYIPPVAGGALLGTLAALVYRKLRDSHLMIHIGSPIFTKISSVFQQNVSSQNTNEPSSYRVNTSQQDPGPLVRNSLDIVQLLENGADVNLKDSSGKTLLHIALERGYLSVAKLLLNKGADINLTDSSGSSPLLIALERGHLDIARLLLDKGADVNLKDSSGISPLLIALGEDHLDIARLLLDKGADVNLKDSSGISPLHIASVKGYVGIARLLLDKGADINLQCPSSGISPLHIASVKGYVGIARLLLDKGADINLKCPSSGISPLHIAVKRNYMNIAKLLVKKGANVNIADNDGSTSLHYVTSPEICELLLQHGAFTNTLDLWNNTPLHEAAKKGLLEIVKTLTGGLVVNDRTNVNMRNNSGNTPVDLAAHHGHTEVVNLFTSYKEHVSASSGFNNTQLFTAGI